MTRSNESLVLRIRYQTESWKARQIAEAGSPGKIYEILKTFLTQDLKVFHLGTAIPKRTNLFRAAPNTLNLNYDAASAVRLSSSLRDGSVADHDSLSYTFLCRFVDGYGRDGYGRGMR